jgi:hypothetical protein
VAVFAGCEGVIHPATPVPEDKLVDPEVSNMLLFLDTVRILRCRCLWEIDLLKV